MSSTNKTLNYLLSQFLGTDRLQRDDYNADMLKIDSTLKAKLTIVDLLTAILAIDGTGSGIDADKLDGADLSTDGTFASNSDAKVPTEKATKTQIAAQVAALVDSSPATLDTLKEIATALGNDPNFATTITTLIGTKIEKSAFTALNDILVGTGAGAYVKKTPVEILTILGLEISASQEANKIVKRDASGNIAGTVNYNGANLIELSASANLNLVITSGEYHSATPTNSPSDSTSTLFYLKVMAQSSTFVLQELTELGGLHGLGRKYIRRLENGTWSAWEKILTDKNDTTPTGSTVMYAGINAPNGWLMCNGQAVTRTGVYAGLFAVIGTLYGTGDGTTTFNVPDFRGVFPKGAGVQGTASWDDISNYDGGVLGTYKQDQIQNHTHRIPTGDNTENNGAGNKPFRNDQSEDSQYDSYGVTDPAGRSGETTEPASLSINFIIKL